MWILGCTLWTHIPEAVRGRSFACTVRLPTEASFFLFHFQEAAEASRMVNDYYNIKYSKTRQFPHVT